MCPLNSAVKEKDEQVFHTFFRASTVASVKEVLSREQLLLLSQEMMQCAILGNTLSMPGSLFISESKLYLCCHFRRRLR